MAAILSGISEDHKQVSWECIDESVSYDTQIDLIPLPGAGPLPNQPAPLGILRAQVEVCMILAAVPAPNITADQY